MWKKYIVTLFPVTFFLVIFFPVTSFPTFLVTFYPVIFFPVTFFRLPLMYCIYNIPLIQSCMQCNFFTFICHSCLYLHCTYLLKQYINIIRPNYQKSLMQIIVCLFMGGHEISIKRIFDFPTSLILLQQICTM
jgi:hypothetical protein